MNEEMKHIPYEIHKRADPRIKLAESWYNPTMTGRSRASTTFSMGSGLAHKWPKALLCGF